jgi:hypothetical protein
MARNTPTTKRTRKPVDVSLDTSALDRLPVAGTEDESQSEWNRTWPIALSFTKSLGAALHTALHWDRKGGKKIVKPEFLSLSGANHLISSYSRGISYVQGIRLSSREDVVTFEAWLRTSIEPAMAAYVPDWSPTTEPGVYCADEIKALVKIRTGLNARLVDVAERYEERVKSQHAANVRAAFATAPTYSITIERLSNNDREVHVSLNVVTGEEQQERGHTERFRSEIDCRFTLVDGVATPRFGFDKYDRCAWRANGNSVERYVASFDEAVSYSTDCLAGLAFQIEAERISRAEDLRVALLAQAEADLKAQANL